MHLRISGIGVFIDLGMVGIWSNPSFIAERAKNADMIFRSSLGLCREDYFSSPRFKKAKLPAEKAGGH